MTSLLTPVLETPNFSSNDTDYSYHYFDFDQRKLKRGLPLFELIPVVLIYGLTMILGIIGNSLVVFSIIRYKRMQNVTNMFLTSLSSADFLLITLCIPIKVSVNNFKD